MSDITPPYPDSYSQAEIQEILQLAIASHHTEDELSRQQLWEIASELDISNAVIQSAERDWLERKAVDRQRRSFDLHRRQKFKQKLTKFAIVNTFLVSLNLIAIGTLSWSLYILLFWGLGIALNGWKAYQSGGEAYEKEFQRWSFQNEVKQTVATVWTKLQKTLQA
ncbi:2TM domain-containing protein [Waterburya agarophytonicola K14]|uniref:2TM domain-containing protein n=1 Tax=Waterburya agarophytonicola KI4 TaxID=2874699 RepID=A0A964BWZ5_9CYAN|nr:2TM domain-containing protein [Waterburya agarophytonicola]MCC0179221.1 2TM domain-containing protein [Waterburya agarophytonicola KI4]